MLDDSIKISFKGGAFHESLHKGKASGSLEIDRNTILFFDTGGYPLVKLPIHEVKVKLGGASNRLVFFSHPDFPGWVLHTADRDILDHPSLAIDATVQRQIDAIRSKRSKAKLITFGILSTIVLGIVCLFALKDTFVGIVVDQVPGSWEVSLGDQIFESLSAGKVFNKDEEALAELNKLVAPLLKSLGKTPYEFKFHIVQDSTINAFAIPGGHVTIHSGLLDAAESPEEILGVLAHEIIHVTEKHSLKQLVGTAGIFLLLQSLAGDLTGLAGVLVSNGSYLLTQKFSRDHERESDDLGFALLIKAKINPQGMVTFFEKLKKQSEATLYGAEESLALLSTHPATSERINHLKARIESIDEDFEFRTLDISLETLRQGFSTP